MPPAFTTSTTVFNNLERYNVPERLGNTIRIQALTVIALNGFLPEGFHKCYEAHIQKAAALIDVLRSENKSARHVVVDSTGNVKNIFERRLANRSKQTASLLVPPIDFFIGEHITPTAVPALVDGIEIARQITLVAFNIYKSIKPTELWNAESSSRNSAAVRRTRCG